MDALFEGLVDQLRTSGRLADSTLLEVVHSAMLDAHKKTVSEENQVSVRLHHNARFYELSIMELECCLKVVREEADNNILEQRNEFEELIASLLEQQALMQKKLEELEIIITEKDRELTSTKQSELKLRLAYNVIGNEVEKALKENVKYSSTNQSRVRNMERDSNGIFDELKSSIKQEVLNIEMKLENARDILTSNMQKLKQDSIDDMIGLKNDGVKILQGLYNIAHLLIEFEDIIADVRIFEENIKYSSEMIKHSTSLFKAKIEENQMQIDMEREVLTLSLKNLVQEGQCNNCKLDSTRVIPSDKTTKLQSTKETLEEAVALREEIDKVVIDSMINEQINKNKGTDIIHSLREDIDNVLFGEIMKDLIKFSSSILTSACCKDSRTNNWNDRKEVIDIKLSLREDIEQVVFSEIIRDFITISSAILTGCLNAENSDNRAWRENINMEVLQDINLSFTKMSESFLDVGTMIDCRTNSSNKRLEDLDRRLDVTKEEIFLLKRKELLYRNAFIRRCYDLETAEAEVDLLGDEVDFLLGLIKKSYQVLDRYLPVLQYHYEVMEIVNLLKSEVEAELQQ